MGKTIFIVLISSCIHCMLLSFSLWVNKIQFKLHYGFTEEQTQEGEQVILQERAYLEFSLGVLFLS